jgi:hypothetical protein
MKPENKPMLEMLCDLVDFCNERFNLALTPVGKMVAVQSAYSQVLMALSQAQNNKNSQMFNVNWNDFLRMRENLRGEE